MSDGNPRINIMISSNNWYLYIALYKKEICLFNFQSGPTHFVLFVKSASVYYITKTCPKNIYKMTVTDS